MAIRLTTYQIFERDKMIRSLAIAQTGAMATLRRIQGVGLGMRKTEFLDLYRNYEKIPAREEVIKYTPDYAAIGVRHYTPAKRFMTRNFRYIVKFETRDKRTGIISEYRTGVISDRRLLPHEIKNQARESIKTIFDLSPVTLQRFWLSEAEYKEDTVWPNLDLRT